MKGKIRIRVTQEFLKRYRTLPKSIQKKVHKQLKFMASNPGHPSLKIHKMNDEWEFYVNKYYRAIFQQEGNLYTLLTVGGHQIVDRYRKK